MSDIDIQKTIAETLKLAAEEQKLRAEERKLEAEAGKLRINRYIAPLAGLGAFLGAAVGVATLVVKLFQ
jgi:hypothetical protein